MAGKYKSSSKSMKYKGGAGGGLGRLQKAKSLPKRKGKKKSY